MSGGSRYQTVGYRYYLGIHFVLCQGPVDRLIGVLVDDKSAWSGSVTTGELTFNAENLFGGTGREGGVAGTLDFMPGELDQPINSYLAGQLGTEDLPAFRKVTSVVLRHFYVGLNPYLKKWAFRVQRAIKSTDGQLQWNPTRAMIRQMDSVNRSMHLMLLIDAGESMNNNGNLARVKAALNDTLEELFAFKDSMGTELNLSIVAFNNSVSQLTWPNVGPNDYSEVADFLANITASGGSDWRVGFTVARDFFSSVPNDGWLRRLLFVSDDDPNPYSSVGQAAGIAADLIDQNSGAFNVAAGTQVDIATVSVGATNRFVPVYDNTPADGTPIVTSSSVVDLTNVFISAISPGSSIDMNPAHIIREGITDLDFGLQYSAADLNEDSFLAAAQTLYEEQMGISILWNRQQTMEDFIGEMQRHIDAAVFVDKSTGLWNIKLIRDDYERESLPRLNTSNILSVNNFKYTALGELVTSVTASFRDARTGRKSTITLQNIALEQYQGARINHSVDYPGFTSSVLMGKIVGRDLKALSREQISCDIVTTRDAFDLNPGSPFILDWPEYGVYDQVMRVDEISFGTIMDASIKIRCTSDVYDTPATAFVGSPTVDYTPPTQTALPILFWDASEAPYFELVQQYAESSVNDLLAGEPDAGFLSVSAASPGGGALNGQFYVDAGTGYELAGTVYFCPVALLDEDISEIQEEFEIAQGRALDGVSPGTYAKLDEELICVLSLETVGDTTTITVKRGVLDTAVRRHLVGAVILFDDAFVEMSSTEYVATDSIDVKVVSVSGAGESPLDAAMSKTVVFESRAIRPYPPGRVQFFITGTGWVYFPNQLESGDLVMRWVGRNRLQQTAAPDIGFLDPHIEPEPGTTYTIRFFNGSTMLLEVADINDFEFTATPEQLEQLSGELRWELYSVRDGYESYQAQSGILYNQHETDPIILENGDFLILENGVDYLTSEDD